MRYLDRLRRTPEEDAPLLPVLRPPDWKLAPVCVSRPLLRGQPGPQIPTVSLGRPKGDGFDMVRRDALPALGMTADEVEHFAIGNLATLPTEWQVEHRNEGTDRPTMLGLPDEGALTASRILDRELMRRAHARIGSSLLLVGLPSLHELYVCDGSPMASLALQKAFRIWLTRHKEAAEGVDPLSDQALVMRDGEVIGVYNAPEDDEQRTR